MVNVNIICIDIVEINKVITFNALIRLVVAVNGVALAFASFDLEVIVFARVLWWIKSAKVGAL
jgi:hypothetical protein